MAHDTSPSALPNLRDLLVRMGGLVEQQIAQAVQALLARDPQAGQSIVLRDQQVDALQAEIDHGAAECLTARQNNLAKVRAVLAFLKAAAALERIGDYAANIAKRAARLGMVESTIFAGALRSMSRLVQEHLRQAIDALEADDAGKAAQIWRGDKAVDDIYTTLTADLLTRMASDQTEIAALTHYLFIARNLERMGDHVTTIAECVYLTVTGENLPSARPKGAGSAGE